MKIFVLLFSLNITTKTVFGQVPFTRFFLWILEMQDRRNHSHLSGNEISCGWTVIRSSGKKSWVMTVYGKFESYLQGPSMLLNETRADRSRSMTRDTKQPAGNLPTNLFGLRLVCSRTDTGFDHNGNIYQVSTYLFYKIFLRRNAHKNRDRFCSIERSRSGHTEEAEEHPRNHEKFFHRVISP